MKPLVINIHNLVENLSIMDNVQASDELKDKITESLNKVLQSAHAQTENSADQSKVNYIEIEEAPQGGRASELEKAFIRAIKRSKSSNTQTRYNYLGKGIFLVDSSCPLSLQSHLQRDLAAFEKSRSRFLETLGLKHESELWIGKKINPELKDRAYQFQKRLRKSLGGQKKSKTEAYKAMRDAIKWLGFAPC